MRLRIIIVLAFAAGAHAQDASDHFLSSENCIACHSNLRTSTGRDVSIGYNWRASMMANSARDPYWHAAVRREVMDHPGAQGAIEDKCSTCHMPMARFEAAAAGGVGQVFANVLGTPSAPHQALAQDGVSCTVCHQIRPDNFGSEASFTGGFQIDRSEPIEQRVIYGPHQVDAGRQALMQSAASFSPNESAHLQASEVCATCHTLYTHALDATGAEIAELAEQVPYLEWRDSVYRDTQSCQDCHMPVLEAETPITSVMGQPRPQLSQHVFRGGNAFMLGILNKYRNELGVKALLQELEAAIQRTRAFLGSQAAEIAIDRLAGGAGLLEVDVSIRNLAGHKLPSAYPSRRVWVHLIVTDPNGNVLFESGRPRADGSIIGNDNDRNGLAYEPHYELIDDPDQVQIYETVLVGEDDTVTTGLLTGVRYAKDNRLLPSGLDKETAGADIAVYGRALGDADFVAPGDRLSYRIAVPDGASAARVSVELLYQSIGFRWAENLKAYDASETNRFVAFYEDSASESIVRLANDVRQLR